MEKKKLCIGVILVIITSTFLINLSYGKGRINTGFENPKVNNPVPLYLPSNYHLWDTKLYFHIKSEFYQYDISNKANISYSNEITIENEESQIKYFQNTMFTFTNIPNESNNNYEFKIVIYELTVYGIEQVRTIKYERENFAIVLCVSDKIIIWHEYNSDSNIPSHFIVDLEQQNPEVYFIEFKETISSNIEHVKLEGNFFYILIDNQEGNYTSLLVYSVEEISDPELLGIWTTSSLGWHSHKTLRKEDDILYIYTSNSIVISINITDTTNPTEIVKFIIPGSLNKEIRIFSNFAFVFNQYNITIYSITKFGLVNKLGNYSGNYFYISEENLAIFDRIIMIIDSLQLQILDWSNPEEIVALDIIIPTRSNNAGLELNSMFLIYVILFFVIGRGFLRRKRK